MAMDLTQQIQAALSRAGNYIHGRDSEVSDLKYASIVEWKEECGLASSAAPSASPSAAGEPKHAWYKTGYNYWEDERNCPATVDGVLGGFASLSKRDLEGSAAFVRELQSTRPALKLTREENGGAPTRACECGAGIGRVSKGLLLPLGITQCDLVEPSPRLISAAPHYIGNECSSKCRYFCTGLQEFEPAENAYNLIWIQWVIGYLTDDDLVAFLQRCAVGLRPGGLIIIKDNTCEEEAFIVDRDDSSTCRSLPYVLEIAEIAGLRVVYQRVQEEFPEDIFPVPMIALEPKRKRGKQDLNAITPQPIFI